MRPRDQVTFECAASFRHYHAPLMHVVLTGRADRRHEAMFRACRDALRECEAAPRPGRTVGDVFAAHARILTRAGYKGHFLNACRHTMGVTYPPTWMDEPMIYADNAEALARHVFFIHMILPNSKTGLSMFVGETSIVTARGSEPVTRAFSLSPAGRGQGEGRIPRRAHGLAPHPRPSPRRGEGASSRRPDRDAESSHTVPVAAFPRAADRPRPSPVRADRPRALTGQRPRAGQVGESCPLLRAAPRLHF